MRPLLPPWAGFVAPVLPLLAFILLAGLWAAGNEAAYRAILAAFGMYPLTPPFLDTHAILAALECHAAGVDVSSTNPCDIQNRPHVYGSVWLWLSPLRLDRTMLYPVAIGLDLAFIAGLLTLPRARRWREVAVLSLACLSPVVLFVMERANNDIVVWLLALIAVRLVMGGAVARGFAYAIACVAGLLKLYPAILLVLLGRERLARALAIGVPLGVALVALLWRETGAPLKHFRSTSYQTDAFGAWNIAQSLLASRADAAWQPLAMTVIVVAMTAYALSLSVRMVTRFGVLARVRALPAFEAWLALAGATMLIACFFAGPSIAYRAIHLLLVLPAVLSLWRAADDRPGAWLFGGVAWVIVWCLWSEATHNHVMQGTHGTDVLDGTQLALIGVVTGLRELAWWWLISVLMALAGCIALTSRAGADFCALLRIRLPG